MTVALRISIVPKLKLEQPINVISKDKYLIKAIELTKNLPLVTVRPVVFVTRETGKYHRKYKLSIASISKPFNARHIITHLSAYTSLFAQLVVFWLAILNKIKCWKLGYRYLYFSKDITCANVECPEFFGHQPLEPGCFRVYEGNTCCSTKTVCRKFKHIELITVNKQTICNFVNATSKQITLASKSTV